jgi:hypothetical protein
MWITDFNGGLIKITTTGTPTASPVNIGAAKNPRGIVAGPDGKMYFTETAPAPAGNRIGRINTDGTGLVETSLLTGGASDPEGIALGQDGNLYVAIFNGSQVGQVTPAMALTQFSTGITANSGPRQIAKGPDGNMWFTEELGNKIGRFTVDPPPTTGGGGGGTTTTTTTTTTPTTPGADTTPAQVSNLQAKPKRFVVGPDATAVAAARRASGTTFTYMLSENARVTLAIERVVAGRKKGASCAKPSRANRKAKRCTRFVSQGTLTRTGQSGQNAVPFSGRIGSKALKPGNYRVGISGTDAAGNTGLRQYTKFTVLASKKAKSAHK